MRYRQYVKTFAVLGLNLLSSGCAIFEFRPVFDVAVGAGPGVIVAETNGTVVRHQPPNGTQVFAGGSPLTCTGVGVHDPDLQYDVATDRWFFTSFDGGGGIALAVSVGATPLSPYACYRFDGVQVFETVVDQPRISVTGNKVTITTQLPGSFTLVLNKADAVANVSVRMAKVQHGNTIFRPTRNVTNENALYLVGAHTNTTLRVKIITGVPGDPQNPVTTAAGNVPMPYDLMAALPDVVDPQGLAHRNFSSARTFHSVEVNQVLYALTATSEAGIGKLGLAQIVGLGNPFLPELFQAMTVDPPDRAAGGVGMVCPALAVTAAHDVVIGFSAASPIRHLSAYFTGRHLGDPLFALRPPVLAFEGEPLSSAPPPGQVARYDYCDGAVAPDLFRTIFAVNFARNTGNSTAVVAVVPSDIQ